MGQEHARSAVELLTANPLSLTIRSMDWGQDSPALLRLLQEQLAPSLDLQRLEWLYRRGPHGKATVWVAAETETGRLVGVAAVFPRRIYFEGGIETGCVLGDFCISAKNRSLGPALRLQRKCLESIGDGGFAVGFDLPSPTMLAIYRRLGCNAGGELVRMTKLLRTDSKFAARTKSKLLARALSMAGNAVLAAERGSSRIRSRDSASIELHTGRFGEKFSELAARVAHRMGNCVERSAEYLNWRYADHPRHSFEVLAARRTDRVEGYLIFQENQNRAAVVDCFSEQPEIRLDLIRALIELALTRGYEAIDAPVFSAHALCDELKGLGFRPRESSPVIFLGRASKGMNSAPTDSTWLLLDGDREG